MVLAVENIIDLLDRRYDFLMQSKNEDFMLDLASFVNFLLENNHIKDSTMKVFSEYAKEQEMYAEIRAKEKKQIVALAEKIKIKYPELDDSAKEYPGHSRDTSDYENSFAAFNDVVNNVKRVESFSLSPDMMDDDSDEERLLNILLNKIHKYEERDDKGKKIKEFDEKLLLEFQNLNAQREFNFREWLNSFRVSAGSALDQLCQTIADINPKPEKYENKDDRFRKLTSITMMKKAHFHGWIQDATYGVVSKYSNYSPAGLKPEQMEEVFSKLKEKAKRIYAAVREEIGVHLLNLQLLKNYKVRCMWYDFDEVRRLVFPSGKLVKNREKIMTLHLARYLFDNGMPVIYRLKAGQHEMDMVAPDAKHPLLVEVKVYKDSTAKNDLVNGLVQVHSYLNNVSGSRGIHEAFYVIYRVGGPLYELPEKIVTNNFVINTIVIDVGLGEESGRKQKKSIVISEKEIRNKIKIT